MSSHAIHTPNPVAQEVLMLVDEQHAGHQVSAPSSHPTGAEILRAAGRPAVPSQIVLQLLHAGGLESIRLEERADLAAGSTFVLSTGDKTFRYTVDVAQFEWPHRLISAGMVRRVANIAPNHQLGLVRPGGGVQMLDEHEVVDLANAGVEKFVTLPPVAHHIWKLKVQGVVLEYREPHVKVADAMMQAGFDPKKAWHIYLIVQGQPKKEVDSSYVVDLRTPGIEKIRLMQRNVDNGDGQASAPRRTFKLLAADTQYLDGLGLSWETVHEANRRWLLIHDYPMLQGLVPARPVLALDIPADYPASQIDMFYFAPFVARQDGRVIDRTQVRASIAGVEYQGWSRHRNAGCPWDPSSDSVRTHLALVESCLAKEMGE
jgi:hypothetical protein